MIDLNDPNILNVYRFGSHVYGTNNKNSDEDFFVIQENFTISDSIDIHHISKNQFQHLLDNQDIQALECYFLPYKHVLKQSHIFTFKLDKSLLRKSISTISDGSWQKGKKKLIVSGDYDKWLALKSIFHSLRIRDIGIQVALEGKIIDYTRMNYVLADLIKLGDQYERNELWEVIDTKYRKTYNTLRSRFIELCPKDDHRQSKIDKILEILKKNDVSLPLEVIKEIVDEG